MCDSNPFVLKETYETSNVVRCTECCSECNEEKKKELLSRGKNCPDDAASG